MLTIHEIVAHATEVDRIVGYEANYAGTSFVKISDLGKLRYGSKLMNITADKTDDGLGSVGYDDDANHRYSSSCIANQTRRRLFSIIESVNP